MSFFTSLTGLNAATAQLGVTSNNIANASTVGFKRSRADFGDIFATSPLQKATSTIGQGVSLKKVTQEFGQGNMNFSSNTLDLAISGDGFFPLKSADGFQDIFTRNGSFMMNDQYNVVNSAGQRLMAASVDSTGKANLNDLNVLTIPQKTTGMAKETSLVQLGLNFPADAQVVTKSFNRNDPASYNKSTALTVYDKGGNGYLATVYYAKTQNASQADPNNKWQTYVYVGETLVAAALQQATDPASGEKMYVNKYGQLKPESEVGDLLVNAKTQKFSLNQLTDLRNSEPATVNGGKAPRLSTLEGIDFSTLQPSQLKDLFEIDVDGTGTPLKVGLDHLAGTSMRLSGTEIAKEFTNVLNRKFGDERYFNFAGQQTFQVTASNADGTLTQNRTIQMDADDMTYEQVVNKINSQLSGSSNVLSNVSFSSTPSPGEFKGYSMTIDGQVISNQIDLGTALSTKPMEDLATKLQTRVQLDLQQRLGYTPEAAGKVTVNVQNGNEVRVTDASGSEISNFVLRSISTGAQNNIENQKTLTGVNLPDIGDYTALTMTLDNDSITLDLTDSDPSDVDVFAQELQDKAQVKLVELGWSTYEASQVTIATDPDVAGKLIVKDVGGHQINALALTAKTGLTGPVLGAGESKTSLASIAFAAEPIDGEPLLSHFKSLSFAINDGVSTETDTITLDSTKFPSLTGVDPAPSYNTFDPTNPDHMDLFAADIQTAIRAASTKGANVNVTWDSNTNALVATESSGKFISALTLEANTTSGTGYPGLAKGGGVVQQDVVQDADGNILTPSSYTLSNVSFPLNTTPTGKEFKSFDIAFDDGTTLTGVDMGDLALSSIPINDLANRIQEKIRTALKENVTPTPTDERVNKITVSVINGKDLKIIDTSGTNIINFSLTAETLTASTVSTGGKNFTIAALPADNMVTASYDPVSQQFSFVPVLGNSITLSGLNNQLGITTPITQEVGSDGLTLGGSPSITNNYIRPLKLQRYGMKVEYDTVNERFIFKSGTTGDNSSIKITNPSTYASERLGLAADGNYEVKQSALAVRGIASEPAVMHGSPLGINANNNFSVNLTNNKFVVSVDDVKGTVYLEPKETYTIDSFVQALQNGINRLAGPSDQPGLTGSMVSGVRVSYDTTTNSLKFTTGTASTNSFIKVSGDSQWGLANVEGGRGNTSTWIKPTQYTQTVNGVSVAMYIDEFGKETFSPDGFKALPEWSPIFLEKGELTFDTGGNLVSPKQGSQLDTVYLPDGKGALTININYSKSTQFSSPYAVLSQSQDGAPEGDLVGLSVGDDGLVNASYSNGAQRSLGKVVLVNFSNPTGLRQIGDTSYYKSSSSGSPKYGEAGSAGFGTVRSGATERANVDLTQELVDLITEQRNFQANAKAIETSTTLTQSIIQIRA
jgi:flagellar hook-basal body protein